MNREQKIARHYLETGILGAYETTEVAHEEESGGKFAPCFEDTTTFFDAVQTSANRSMYIEGRRFRICSVFPAESDCTPTDKLLGLIDAELTKENRTA